MKALRLLIGSVLVAFLLVPLSGLAAEKKDKKLKPYPLKTCIISGDKLGEMGEPFVYEYQGREIKFCCKGCLKDFKKDPAKYIKMIDEAAAKEAKKAKS
jgi:YHS domain-containing protein